jgi:hypothetical protein
MAVTLLVRSFRSQTRRDLSRNTKLCISKFVATSARDLSADNGRYRVYCAVIHVTTWVASSLLAEVSTCTKTS